MKRRELLLALAALAPCLAGHGLARAGEDGEARDAVERTGVLKVAVYRDFFPFSDASEGGIDVEIAQALADRLGAHLNLLPFDAGDTVNDDLRNMVWKGHYMGYGPADVMLHVPFDSVLSRQNEQVHIFSPYHVESMALAVDTARIPDWQGFEVFRGLKIAVDGGSYAAQIVLGLDNGAYRDNVVLSRTVRAAIEELKAGRVAAVMATRSELQAGGATALPYQLVDFNLPGAPQRSWAVGLAVKEERKALAARLSAAVKAMQDDGALAAIYARHGVRYVQP